MADFVQSVLSYTRIHISHGGLENETWYQKLDEEARDKYRLSGRKMMFSLMTFLVSHDEAAQAEAHNVGYDYARLGRRQGLLPAEATTAFLFFRTALIESVFNVYEKTVILSPTAWKEMIRKINAYTDRVLLSLLELLPYVSGGQVQQVLSMISKVLVFQSTQAGYH
jgi:hypothetical protein